MVYKSIYILFITFLISFDAFSHDQTIQFDNYGTDQGLSNEYVNCAFKDLQGFMWFGTANGLNRFDGFSFTNYYVDNYDTLSIPGNGVGTLNEDAYGNLWIGTINGVCTYNREKNNFIRKTLIVSDSVSFDEIYTRSMLIDNNGYLWIGSFDGIFRIKLDNKTASQSQVYADHYTLNEPLTDKSHQQFIGNFAQSPDNTIWLTSYSNNLFWFDSNKQEFIPQLIDIQNPGNLLNNEKRLLIDNEGDFYIAVAENGLVIWDISSNSFSLLSPNNTTKSPKGTVLYAMGCDNKGQIWIGDRLSEGISIYNKKTKEFLNIKHDEASITSLISNKINNIYCDNTGTVWVNTIIGISKYSPGKIKFKSYYYSPHAPNKLNYNNILCFEESSNGDIWIGTDGMGINKMNPKTGICKHFVHDPNIKNTPSSNAIISLLEDHNGVLWAGTFNGGLLKYENGKFSSYMPNPNNPNSISNQHVWYVFEDSKQNLWISTMNTGISLFDRKTEKFYHYQHQQNKPGSLVDNTMYGIFEDSKQNIYFTSIAGVFLMFGS